jgi:hypothetical protein
MRRVLGFVLVASLFAIPYAQAGQPRTHDGLFLRLSGGVGFENTSFEDLELSGTGGDGNFAIGGTVGRNLILHGTLWGWDVSDPDFEIDNTDTHGEIQGDVSLGALGGGLTYYLEPSNIYLSGSLGMGKLSYEDPSGNTSDTDLGVALDFCLGKEWWVGNSWGLGIAGDLNYHSFPDDVSNGNWDGVSFAIRFSATLN